MADAIPQFESIDLSGSTAHYVGTVGTTPTSIPGASGAPIAEVLINTQSITSGSARLLVSFDAGTTFTTIKRNTILGWSPRGPITQLVIKGNEAGVEYDLVVNYEVP